MKSFFRKLLIRLTALVCLVFLLFMGLIFNPGLAYAGKTQHKGVIVYHNQDLPEGFLNSLDHSMELVKKSELYDPDIAFRVCLHDGSFYPYLLHSTMGDAFAYGFSNKIVLWAEVGEKGEKALIHGKSWPLSRLIAHEAVHCLQYNYHGFWASNPVKGWPNWKWEGYPEYIARQSPETPALEDCLTFYLKSLEEEGSNAWLTLWDGSGAPISYFKNWIMTRYCFEIEHTDYKSFIMDSRQEDEVFEKLQRWVAQKSTTGAS